MINFSSSKNYKTFETTGSQEVVCGKTMLCLIVFLEHSDSNIINPVRREESRGVGAIPPSLKCCDREDCMVKYEDEDCEKLIKRCLCWLIVPPLQYLKKVF